MFFDSSTDGLDVKPVLGLFNNTCAANGNALCPATLPLVFAIGNGVMNPQSVLLGKSARGQKIRNGSFRGNGDYRVRSILGTLLYAVVRDLRLHYRDAIMDLQEVLICLQVRVLSQSIYRLPIGLLQSCCQSNIHDLEILYKNRNMEIRGEETEYKTHNAPVGVRYEF